jgi:hypothetical protein
MLYQSDYVRVWDDNPADERREAARAYTKGVRGNHGCGGGDGDGSQRAAILPDQGAKGAVHGNRGRVLCKRKVQEKTVPNRRVSTKEVPRFNDCDGEV